MAREIKALRLVIASPADTLPERNLVPVVVQELNNSVCADRAIRIETVRWETDTYPGFHPEGPQGLIDPILGIEDCDLLIGIFWKRFGTPTKDARSGTAHEFQLAYEAWRNNNRPQVMVYFNQKAYTPQSKEETDQWGQVLEFRKTFPSEGLWWSYRGAFDFEKLLRTHLSNFIRAKFPLEQVSFSPVSALAANAGPARKVRDDYFAVQAKIV